MLASIWDLDPPALQGLGSLHSSKDAVCSPSECSNRWQSAQHPPCNRQYSKPEGEWSYLHIEYVIFATSVVAPGLQLAECRKEVAALFSSSLALNTPSFPLNLYLDLWRLSGPKRQVWWGNISSFQHEEIPPIAVWFLFCKTELPSRPRYSTKNPGNSCSLYEEVRAAFCQQTAMSSLVWNNSLTRLFVDTTHLFVRDIRMEGGEGVSALVLGGIKCVT